MQTRTDPDGIGLTKARSFFQKLHNEIHRRENEAMRTMYLGPDGEPSLRCSQESVNFLSDAAGVDREVWSPPVRRTSIEKLLGISHGSVYGRNGIGAFWKRYAEEQRTEAPHLPWKEFFTEASKAVLRAKSEIAEDRQIYSIEDLQDFFPWGRERDF